MVSQDCLCAPTLPFPLQRSILRISRSRLKLSKTAHSSIFPLLPIFGIGHSEENEPLRWHVLANVVCTISRNSPAACNVHGGDWCNARVVSGLHHAVTLLFGRNDRLLPKDFLAPPRWLLNSKKASKPWPLGKNARLPTPQFSHSSHCFRFPPRRGDSQ